METGFVKGDSANLPKIDSLMVANFFASNKDFCEAELRNVKTSLSSRESYGDDAVGYVQLKRVSYLCTVRCRVCPEHRVRTKPYTVIVAVDEKNGIVVSVQCQDCAASAGGCKHAVAFLMWLHRRSEEPSCTQVECYWKKSQLSKVGTSLKFITAIEMARGNTSTMSDNSVLNKFVEQAAAKNIKNCELVRYLQNIPKQLEEISMYQLAIKYRVTSSDEFIIKILPLFTSEILKKVEEKTRDQFKSNLWFELRFARITASRAYDISKCQTSDGSLVSLLMGGKIPDTPAMRRGRVLEQKVLEVVQNILGKKIKKCGLFISKQHPMIAASPDGIGEQFLVEIKCPFSEDTMKNYIQEGKPAKRHLAQIQLQMYVCELKRSYYCVADSNFQTNNKVHIMKINFNEAYVNSLLGSVISFWKSNIYPLLFKMSEI